MSVKIIACLDPFSNKRTVFEAAPGTIKDVINSLNVKHPLSQARACLNGETVTDFSTEAKDGDLLTVKFVPCGNSQQAGSGMKAGGWGLATLGVIAIGLIGWTGVGMLVGSALIGTGLSLALGGTVLMNLGVPKPRDVEKPDVDPSIRGGRNQARPHGRMPVLFGRRRVYPDLAANPHTSVIGNGQYFTQLFCGGYKDCVIDLDSLKLGETPLVNFSQTKDIKAVLSGDDPFVSLEILQNGEASKLYPRCVHEEQINAPLQHEIEDGEGNKTSGEIERVTPDGVDEINVDIFFHAGIGKYDDKGGVVPASVEVRAWYKKGNDGYSLLGYFNEGSNAVSGNELKTKRFQITKSGLAPGKYTVKIERVTPDSTDSKIIDQAHVGSIRSVKSKDKDGKDVRPIREERQKCLAIIALRVLAVGKLKDVIDGFNYVATSKLPVYSGGGSGPLYWLASAETRNPAAALLHALQGGAAQERISPDDLDWPSFEDFYLWCEKHEYYCDAYLSEPVTAAEIFKMIGGTARADILRIDSKIAVVQDVERPSPMGLFTPKNSINYGVTMLQADVPDAIALRYIDEESGYAQNELTVYNTPDGNRAKEPEKIQKADLWGVTGSKQARRVGMYNYACVKNRPFVHTIELDIECLTCNKGDRIQYAGDVALTGSVQGRIAGTIWSEDGRCVGIRADEPVPDTAGLQRAVRLRLPDGAVLLKDVALVREPREIYFTEPCEAGRAPAAGNVYAFGVRGKEVIDLVITDIQPQANFTAVLTCVEYSPEIFGVDDDNFILPEFENKITPVSGAADSGVIGQDRWKLFIVYHDGDKEPPRPSGDGQSNGWHYAHTSRALWQSSKSAETADSGEWGPPVRIKGERSISDAAPVWLSLSRQTVILDCDANGAILAGLLPFTVQAELFKWSYKIPPVGGIPRYPGTGGALFDPMPGDFFPVESERDVAFSLENAPQGVSINNDGMITVSAAAKLDGERGVAVRAEYEGAVYSAVLFIQVKKRVGENNYLGTIQTLPQNNPNVLIIKGPSPGLMTAVQGSYVLAVASGAAGAHTWTAGRVYQWTGLAWEYRDADKHSNLYVSCFKDGLDAPDLTQDMGWFGNLFARNFFALKAYIEKVETMLLTLKNGGLIQSEAVDPSSNEPLFLLRSDGFLKAINAVFQNTNIVKGFFSGIEADAIKITGDSSFSGNIDSGVLKVLPSSVTAFTLANPQNTAQISNFMGGVRDSLGYPPNIAKFTVFPSTGSYYFPAGGNFVWEKIKSITFQTSYSAPNPTCIIVTSVNNRNQNINMSSPGVNLPDALTFYVGTSARTLRLEGLPTSTAVSGEVYEKDNGYGEWQLMIKK